MVEEDGMLLIAYVLDRGGGDDGEGNDAGGRDVIWW